MPERSSFGRDVSDHSIVSLMYPTYIHAHIRISYPRQYPHMPSPPLHALRISTLCRWADTMTQENSAGEMVAFNHPFFQADGMFIGEMTCEWGGNWSHFLYINYIATISSAYNFWLTNWENYVQFSIIKLHRLG